MAVRVDRDPLKRAAAERAVEFVESGMVVGLGTGSTAAFVVEALAARVAQGLAVVAIPTSEHTAEHGAPARHPAANFAEHRRIDLAIDGADEVERGSLDLIKGRGGALLREKIVAAASERFVVVVDDEKLVDRLGERVPVPVEVAQFGWQATAAALEELGAKARAAAGRRPALRHRRRQLHPRLPFRLDRDAAETRARHQPDRRRRRERAVRRPQRRRRRRVGRRDRDHDPRRRSDAR